MLPLRAPLLLVLLALLLLATPAIDAQPPGQGPGARGGERERTMASEEARDWANLTEAARERGLARAEAARLFSRLDWRDGSATSRFVSFNYSGGSLHDFTVRTDNGSVSFFTSLAVTGFEATTPQASGTSLRAMGNETFFAAHGNPLGLFSYRVRNATLQMAFDLADGVNASSESPRSFRVLAPGGAHGHVIISQNATYTIAADNASVDVTLGPHARLLFIHHAVGTAASATLHAVRDGVANDRVGGILSLAADGGSIVQDRVFLNGVAMRATHARDGRVDVVVSSDNPRGRAVLINLDPASVGLAAGANVTVLLDGQPIPTVADPAVALSSTDAVAHVNASAAGTQLIVAVPRFSDHTITVQSASPAPTTTTAATSPTTSPEGGATPTPETDADAPGPALALVLLAAAALALLRRR